MIIGTWLAMNMTDDTPSVRVADRVVTYRRVIVKAASNCTVRILPVRSNHHPWRSNCADRVLRLIDQA